MGVVWERRGTGNTSQSSLDLGFRFELAAMYRTHTHTVKHSQALSTNTQYDTLPQQRKCSSLVIILESKYVEAILVF